MTIRDQELEDNTFQGEVVDNLSIIGKNEVKIYDKNGKLRLHYTGIPI